MLLKISILSIVVLSIMLGTIKYKLESTKDDLKYAIEAQGILVNHIELTEKVLDETNNEFEKYVINMKNQVKVISEGNTEKLKVAVKVAIAKEKINVEVDDEAVNPIIANVFNWLHKQETVTSESNYTNKAN